MTPFDLAVYILKVIAWLAVLIGLVAAALWMVRWALQVLRWLLRLVAGRSYQSFDIAFQRFEKRGVLVVVDWWQGKGVYARIAWVFVLGAIGAFALFLIRMKWQDAGTVRLP